MKEQNIRFVRLQFTDIFGQCKNVAITESQLEKALANKCMFDGSSIEGSCGLRNPICICIRIRQLYDLSLEARARQGSPPDLRRIKPTELPLRATPEAFCAASLAEAAKMGFTFNVGPECEFFLFQTDDEGYPTTTTIDHGAILSWALWTGGKTPGGIFA